MCCKPHCSAAYKARYGLLSPDQLTTTLPALAEAQRVYVGYSGGVDSHVLLHLAASHPALQGKITAVYIHHGLQVVADEWAVHCAAEAQRLNVAFQCIHVNAQANKGESPEAAARAARYQALTPLLQNGDVLLLAQHQDDQLETVLLQLFRGAGLAGLAGMPLSMPLGQGIAARPLLHTPKAEILHYATQQGLHWVEDPSNRSDAFDRNYLRNQVLPLLKNRWPSIARTVSRSAQHCGSAAAALQQESSVLFAAAFTEPTQSLDMDVLGRFSPEQQRRVIRHWLRARGYKMPSEALINALFTQVIATEPQRDPLLAWQDIVFRRYRGQLYALPAAALAVSLPTTPLIWPKGHDCLQLNDGATLRIYPTNQGIDRRQWDNGVVTVRWRQGGEKIRLPGRAGTHCLKKLFQAAGIAPWLREQMPLLYIDGELAAVGELWISAHVWSTDAYGALRLSWQQSASAGDNTAPQCSASF